MTVSAGILDTTFGFDASAENPYDSPHSPLGAESGRTVSKAECCINVREVFPADGKVDGMGGVKLKPPVPATEVQFEHKQPLARIQLSTLLNESDNGFRGGKEQFPDLPAMSMRGNKGVDARADL